jgi:hypothetical protein
MEMKYACLFALPAMLTFSTFKKDIPDEPPVSIHFREVQCSVQNLAFKSIIIQDSTTINPASVSIM